MKRIIHISAFAFLIISIPLSGRATSTDSLYRVPVAAFRSNLLAPLVNVGIEVPVSNRVSLEADFFSPWAMREWLDRKLPANRYCFQLAGGTAGCRLWLGNTHSAKSGDPARRLLGHSIGIIAAGGIYDFEWDGRGQQGEFAFLGADYLYGLALGKGGIHFEFNIGLGYGINLFNGYNVRYEGGKLIGDGGRRHRHLPVPVRLGISLVVPIHKIQHTTVAEASEGPRQ